MLIKFIIFQVEILVFILIRFCWKKISKLVYNPYDWIQMCEVVKKKVIKLLFDVGFIYPIYDSEWVNLVQVVPKKMRDHRYKKWQQEVDSYKKITVCIDYRRLINATWKDHFPLLFIDQMLERLFGHSFYCFLDEF